MTLPAVAVDSASPPSAATTGPVTAGSFRLAQVRILSVPMINVASPSVVGPDTGQNAAERTRVIEGNLELLYRPQQPCAQGERIGEMIDVDVLSTELRCQDQRVVVPNSGCEQSLNHTKLSSGAEVSLLLEPPSLLGVEAMIADGLLVGVLLITEAGQQREDRRELLARLVQRLASGA